MVELALPPSDRRRVVHGRNIAAYYGEKPRWFWKQRERGKVPPPHYKHPAGFIYAWEDELAAWGNARAKYGQRT